VLRSVSRHVSAHGGCHAVMIPNSNHNRVDLLMACLYVAQETGPSAGWVPRHDQERVWQAERMVHHWLEDTPDVDAP